MNSKVSNALNLMGLIHILRQYSPKVNQALSARFAFLNDVVRVRTFFIAPKNRAVPEGSGAVERKECSTGTASEQRRTGSSATSAIRATSRERCTHSCS